MCRDQGRSYGVGQKGMDKGDLKKIQLKKEDENRG